MDFDIFSTHVCPSQQQKFFVATQLWQTSPVRNGVIWSPSKKNTVPQTITTPLPLPRLLLCTRTDVRSEMPCLWWHQCNHHFAFLTHL